MLKKNVYLKKKIYIFWKDLEKFYILVEFNVDENVKIQVEQELSNFEDSKCFYLEPDQKIYVRTKIKKILETKE